MHYGAESELFEFAKELRKNQTKTEDILWERIRNRKLLGFKFRRQHPISKYIADFYCHRLKFVIELDGGYHSDLEQVKYDFNRDGDMEQLGIYVCRIKNEEILNNLTIVISELLLKLKVREAFLLQEARR